jgi:hypothetical protein
MGARIENGQLLTDRGEVADTIHILEPELGGFANKGDIGRPAQVRFVAASPTEDPGGHHLDVAHLRTEREWAETYLNESGWLAPLFQWLGPEGQEWLGWDERAWGNPGAICPEMLPHADLSRAPKTAD